MPNGKYKQIWNKEHMLYAIFTFLITCFLCLTLIQCTGREINREAFPEYSGEIILMGGKCEYFDIRSGKSSIIDFKDKHFIPRIGCKGPDDTFIVIANKIYNMNSFESRAYQSRYLSSVLHVYNQANNSMIPIKALTYDKYEVSSIDYCSGTNKYLYCGYYRSGFGLFILDSLFSLEKDITSLLLDQKNKRARAHFVSDSAIMVSDNSGNIYLVNLGDSSREEMGEGCVLAISKDRKLILISEECSSDAYRQMSIYYIEDGSRKFIGPIKSTSNVFEFSPDNMEIAYFKRIGILGDGMQLVIYDIDKNMSYLTDIKLGNERWGGSINWIDP